MDDQNKNLILAVALSFLVILIWFVVFPPPEPEATLDNASLEAPLEAPVPSTASAPQASAPGQTAQGTTAPVDTDIQNAPRVAIETPSLSGTISLIGGRIDDLSLKQYKTSIEPGAEIVTMLAPVGSAEPYYALYGWAPSAGIAPDQVPGAFTEWTLTQGETLGPDSPITLQWDNGAGLLFERVIAVDEDFMFSVTQSVRNNTEAAVSLAPYGVLARHGQPADAKNFFILHEGAIRFADDELTETDWDDFADDGSRDRVDVTEAGWTGFTDHYWQSVLIPPAQATAKLETFLEPNRGIYQTSATLGTQTVAPGASSSVTTQLFAGAKEWETIRAYQNAGVAKFIDSIDWGWFFFLTKPIFWLLHELNKLIGNMGWAIIGLTLIIKAVLFPLAYKSYVSMAKMKELQPEMEKLKERAGDDRQKLQQEMMELYKREKVNPAAGCLPILLQIPIFFSLYKVIFVTIELRQASWLGPFRDLSTPDPTSLINLFGLLPFDSPEPGSILALIFIGILPLILGISMWLQQKLNPAPTDPTQQMIFAWMPWVFMFMLGGFASGLVIYWIANNVITFSQQYIIMRSQGYTPDILGNIRGSFRSKGKDDA
ncbi:membrane protein insertase YidC [Aliishimia ponticola]|uniref:Membrane protein insertase YidC n=1 Tax=Aliishimia ponticola TaxID=2499833 RepID=A0A4S4N5S5_9RHOB|nr:membrane protein insertase YidC [Aliishimia ponticola]THH34456.1 membrane protein insertase YidC [Aliishimia ponticola]